MSSEVTGQLDTREARSDHGNVPADDRTIWELRDVPDHLVTTAYSPADMGRCRNITKGYLRIGRVMRYGDMSAPSISASG